MYVMKVRGQDIYLAIDENNNMYETENIEDAKIFTKEKAENILENHSIPEWDKYRIKEYFPKPKNQIDYIEEDALRELKEDTMDKTALIKDAEKLVQNIYFAKVNIKNDIEYYSARLTDVQRAITDVSHYMEQIDENDIKKIIDIGTLNIRVFKKRREYKNKLDLLEELNKELSGDFSTDIDAKLEKEKKYTPRILNELFENNIIPNVDELFPEEVF